MRARTASTKILAPRSLLAACRYVGLFPLLMRLLPADSPELGRLLQHLRNQDQLWTPFGLRWAKHSRESRKHAMHIDGVATSLHDKKQRTVPCVLQHALRECPLSSSASQDNPRVILLGQAGHIPVYPDLISASVIQRTASFLCLVMPSPWS